VLAGCIPEGKYAQQRATLSHVSPQPTLYLHGEDDGCIAAELITDSEQHLAPGSSVRLVPAAGHFPHLERPDEVNRAIIAWVTG
jgi:pimeloyl-ACP methyl ester carboxylesterase